MPADHRPACRFHIFQRGGIAGVQRLAGENQADLRMRLGSTVECIVLLEEGKVAQHDRAVLLRLPGRGDGVGGVAQGRGLGHHVARPVEVVLVDDVRLACRQTPARTCRTAPCRRRTPFPEWCSASCPSCSTRSGSRPCPTVPAAGPSARPRRRGRTSVRVAAAGGRGPGGYT